MALVDDPHNGPHLYRVWAAVTTGEEQPHSTLVLESSTSTFTRQLTLLRLPPDVVSGPCRCDGQTVVEEDRWTEIVGLSVRVHVRHSRDRVLVVYHANFEPSGLRYDAFFTVFRETAHRQQNMGLESTGMWSVSSHAAASSEFPHAMFVDVPGRGTHTYSVWARTCRCDEQLVAEPVGVGPDGQIAVVLLEQSKSQGVSTAHL